MTRKPGYVAAGITGLLLSAGVGIPLALLSGLGGTDRQEPPAEPHKAGANVARLICAEGRATRVTPRAVQPQVDGVHISVENRATSPVVLDYTDARGAYRTEPIDPGVGELTLGIAPGPARIGCRAAANPTGRSDLKPLQIEDPLNLWISPDLECQNGSVSQLDSDHPPGAPGRRGNPIELAIIHLPFSPLPEDEIRRAGYPEGPGFHGELVAIVRGGRTIATVFLLEAADGGWLTSRIESCAADHSGPSDPVPTPSVAEIVCERDGTTRVLTPKAQPQRDGVHLRVDNRTGREMELAVQGDTQSHGASEYAPPGTTSLVTSIAPGKVRVWCADWNDPPEVPGPSDDLTIVDPEGLWVSRELDCGPPTGDVGIMSVIHDHFFASPGERGDPVELARSHFGWADPGDIVEPAGYPEADGGALIRVVRGGRVVAIASYDADGEGGWLLGYEEACSGPDTAPAAENPAGP